MHTSINVPASAAPHEPDARGSDRVAPDAESRQPSVGTKRPNHDISDPEIWSTEFWNIIFGGLSLDMKRDSVLAKAIHPFLWKINNQIHQAHRDHHEGPTISSFKNFEEKHAFVLYLRQ